jgi:endonuclease/exonuclease/phosphatase family metal-dependent hydrolase
VQAANVLAKRTQEILKTNPQMSILAMGDFNTIDENKPNPFKTVLFKNDLFKDVGQTFFEDKHIDENRKKNMAQGTYYYAPKYEWNFLDHFFVNKKLLNGPGLGVLVNSFEVYSPAFINTILRIKANRGEQKNYENIMVPKRFNLKGRTRESMGYSDHYPILVKLEYPESSVSKPKKHHK